MASITLNTDAAGGTRDILPLVKAALGYANQDSSRDALLCVLAEEAMGKYVELEPLINRTTFLTVQGQLSYPLPTDCKSVFDVALPSQYGYYNDTLFLPMIDTPSSSLFGYSDYAWRSPSERVIRSGILQELDHYATAFIGYKIELGAPVPQMFLFPTATASGLKVIVRYGAEHLNQSTDPLAPVWNTLPPGRWRVFITLMRWAVMMQRASQLLSTMNMEGSAGGGGKMTESWQLMNAADRLLQQARMALGSDATLAIKG